MSKGTASRENAMTPAELDAFLGEPREARLATVRPDGDVHLSPVWFLWEDGVVRFLLEAKRLHLANLRRRPRATLLVDEDRRPQDGVGAPARAALFRGPVTIEDDHAVADPVHRRLMERYYGEEPVQPPGFRYSLCTLTPEATTTWDFTKG